VPRKRIEQRLGLSTDDRKSTMNGGVSW
jgi:hypothetical protein